VVSVRGTGYLHPEYARTLSAIGRPRPLPSSGGWFLEREIPGETLVDGAGCYPLFCCQNWSALARDISDLGDELVSFTVVTDPFGAFTSDDLGRAFDLIRPYKPHYVTDLGAARDVPRTRRHRRNTAAAQRAVAVRRVTDPEALGSEWVRLYASLMTHRRLTGLHAFPPECLVAQLRVPGIRMFAATAGAEIVGLHLWYVQDDVAYGHLGATSPRGYALMAAYALYAHALEELKSEVRWLGLGGTAGVDPPNSADGLARFKAGWATETRQTYLCGRVLQPDAYDRLAHVRGGADSGYFPRYRHPDASNGTASRPGALER
jgi:hypothetical protein